MKYNKTSLATAIIAATIFSTSLSADEDAFLKCSTIKANEARLACYDKAAKRAKPANPETAPIVAAPLKTQKKQLEQEIAQLKRQKEALDEAERNRKSVTDINYDGLSATVTKVKKLFDGRLRVFLNNNQVWDQADEKRVRGIKKGVIIEMEEGVWGAIFIRAQNRKRGAKFRRIK